MSDLENKPKKKDNKYSNIKTIEDKHYGRRHWEIVEAPATEDDTNNQKLKDKLNKAETLVNLRSRTEELAIESYIGKKILVNKETPKERQGGFYCKTCECLMKDSQSYLDHINGKEHAKMLGMNMKVERVGVEKIKEKFQKLRKTDEKLLGQGLVYKEEYTSSVKAKISLEDDNLKIFEKGTKKVKLEKEKIDINPEEIIEPTGAENFGLPCSFGCSARKK